MSAETLLHRAIAALRERGGLPDRCWRAMGFVLNSRRDGETAVRR